MLDYENCPIGIKNSSDIDHLEDKTDMMMAHITEKIEEINSMVRKGFTEIASKIDKIGKRIDSIEEELPKKIDERIIYHEKDKGYKLAKWVGVSLIGGVIISSASSLLGRYLAHLFGL